MSTSLINRMNTEAKTMTPQQQKVKDWMVIFGQEVHDKFTVPAFDTRLLRLRLHREEESELINAIMFNDRIAIADGCADLLYVLYGTACSYGVEVKHWPVPTEPFTREILQHVALINSTILVEYLSLVDLNWAVNVIYAFAKGRYNIPLFEVFDAVHTNNMEKFWTTSQIESALGLEHGELSKSTNLKHPILNARRPDVTSLWAVTDQHGKVIKPIGFRPVDLTAIVK